jgi:hypothetical protein
MGGLQEGESPPFFLRTTPKNCLRLDRQRTPAFGKDFGPARISLLADGRADG